MTTIFKYELLFDQNANAVFYAPPGRLLKVGVQNGIIMAWVEHDPEQPKLEYRIRAVMTGEEIPDDFETEWTYVDTVFQGWLVIHLYEHLRVQ